jgi:hypothetical protein
MSKKPEEVKICPFCQEEIIKTATICRFCKYDTTASYKHCDQCMELIKTVAKICHFCMHPNSPGPTNPSGAGALPIPQSEPDSENSQIIPPLTKQNHESPPAVQGSKSKLGETTLHLGYGEGVRRQVFDVIVRQALSGAPWRQICAGPMEVNNISEAEVEAELRRRKGDRFS